jgi:hypothetical protein
MGERGERRLAHRRPFPTSSLARIVLCTDSQQRGEAALARRAPSRLDGLEENMRKKFLQGCSSAREARSHARWAAVVVQAVGGYSAFESAHDAARWRAQKKPMPREGRVAP